MMTGTITDDGARALAAFIHTIRPDWDVAGIRPALSQARHRAPAHELAIAAIRCAMSGTAKTPAVIGMDGPHWSGLVAAARVVRPADIPRCDKPCHEHETLPCRLCAADEKAASESMPVVILDEAQAARNTQMAGRIKGGWRGDT